MPTVIAPVRYQFSIVTSAGSSAEMAIPVPSKTCSSASSIWVASAPDVAALVSTTEHTEPSGRSSMVVNHAPPAVGRLTVSSKAVIEPGAMQSTSIRNGPVPNWAAAAPRTALVTVSEPTS